MQNDYTLRLLTELMDGIDRGDFNDPASLPVKYTYDHLSSLFYYADELEGGRELYRDMWKIAMDCALYHVKAKASRGEKLRVFFLTYSAAEWPAESLYKLLVADSRFDVHILVCKMTQMHPEVALTRFRTTLDYFISHGYRTVAGFDEKNDCDLNYMRLGGFPDILINLTPWIRNLSPFLSPLNLPLKCLNLFIPYGFHTADSTDGSYLHDIIYNAHLASIVWRVYSFSVSENEGYRAHSFLSGDNTLFSGFPKMDCFMAGYPPADEAEIRTLWKIPDDKPVQSLRRVIIAPHHSLMPDQLVSFGTFSHNARFLQELARQIGDSVTFILKPHPNLRLTAVNSGLFPDFASFDAYIDEWNRMPNARVVTEDQYLDLFRTSDAMIMDSGSFLAEYLYVNKPLLFLTKEGQAFSTLGERTLSAYYTVPGTDFDGITNFLKRVVIDGQDEKESARAQVFAEELDYVSLNGCLAGERIYQDILSFL
ncbi:MAG: CDP-glycerol glycerophosphotransferase family protein [Lachnospiraceae bacterium]|nr:CDP-glycerol glycerophosphotransferase family protein [Lachnospiraceae bacterium]